MAADFDDRMAALRARFRIRLREERTVLSSLLPMLQSEAARHEVRDRAHKLAGLAGSMGHSDLSARAKDVDRAIRDGDSDPSSALSNLLAALENACAE